MHDRVIAWIDRRVTDMLAAPQMWGSREAVELQTLLLMELRALVLRPSFDAEDPRRVLDAYVAFLAKRYPSVPPQALFQHAPEASVDEASFVDALEAFQRSITAMIGRENPFEHSELTIAMRFAAEHEVSMAACTGYLEDFRRALRGVVAPPSRSGRRHKGIEQATDFTLEDARISAKNGQPAAMIVKLGSPQGQADLFAKEQVVQGLTQLITVAEWADSQEDVAALAIDDLELRTHAALQTRRLIPRRDIASVEIGGKIIGRAKPVRIEASREARIMSVVAAQSEPEEFSRADEIRAIDLDRGTIRLGSKPGVLCFGSPDQLDGVDRVGVSARVEGQLYRSPLGKQPFVFATSIDLEDGPDEAIEA